MQILIKKIKPFVNMARNFPTALDYLGSEAEDFNKAQHLYLKPMAVIKITVVLPRVRFFNYHNYIDLLFNCR